MVIRTVVWILSVLMLFLSMGFTFSDTDNLKGPKENGDITIQYQSISKIETNLSFIGAYATPLIRVTPINYVEVDQVVLDVK
ncbi:MAG: hypothetical protein GX799_05150, partial [Crenarchaeota archaeon]|nr:hypothetical protein [Thermoproteota archaeon]